MDIGDELINALIVDYQQKGPDSPRAIELLSTFQRDKHRQFNRCSCVCGCYFFTERCANRYVDQVCKQAQIRLDITG